MTSRSAARDQPGDGSDSHEAARRVSPLAGIGFVLLLVGCATTMIGVMALHFDHNVGRISVGVGVVLIVISAVLLGVFLRASGHRSR